MILRVDLPFSLSLLFESPNPHAVFRREIERIFGLHIERLIPFVEVANHAVNAELRWGMRVGGEALDQRVFAVLSLPYLRPA